jgi:hypothetical protein
MLTGWLSALILGGPLSSPARYKAPGWLVVSPRIN